MTLRCTKLGCRRGARILFKNLAFELRPGDVLRVTGDNGSGKSTLLRILAGLRPPDAGTVQWQDADIHREPAVLRNDLLFIGHAPGVKANLTALENILHGAMLTGAGAHADALAALGHAGLAAHADALGRSLSQGQRRRVALARLYLGPRKPIWILDEPFVGLDSGMVTALQVAMQRHRAAGGITVYTTHQDAGTQGECQLQLGSGA